jgi:hypothetical protein
MISILPAVRSKRERTLEGDRLRRRPSHRHTVFGLLAVALFTGGRMARADQGTPAAVPIATERTASAKAGTQGFSARALVAQADADLAAGHPGLAILEYERARLLAPRAPAVTSGLAHARSTAGLPVSTESLANRAMEHLDPNEWGWLAMAGLILTGTAAVALGWGLIRRRGFVALAVAGVALAAVGILGTVEVTPGRDSAVVVAADTVARIAPFTKADEAFSVPEGSRVTVERTHDHYILIACPEGQGWVPEGGVQLILPATGKRS